MKKDLITSDFYKLPKWLITIKGLQPADMLIYCIAYNHRSLSQINDNIDEKGRIYFFLTNEGLRKTLGMGRRQIQNSIKRLKECGAIIGERKGGQATRYFLETDADKINFHFKKPQKDTGPDEDYVIPQEEPMESPKGTHTKAPKGPINKKEYNKKEISEIDEIRKGLLGAAITPLLKDKLMEYIDYREQIGKPIKRYKAIELTINQIGSTFIDEQHLIDSIDETFMYEYQGIFPAKLKKLTATDKVESTAMKRLRKLREGQNSERGDIS